MPSKHILSNFERALDRINGDVIKMAKLARHNLDTSIKGLLERDSTLCSEVIADDDEVDQLEMSVDRNGMEIIMLYQPVASDMRRILSLMKVSQNLERVSDQASNIAKRARKIIRNAEIEEARMIEPIYKEAAAILANSINSFTEGSVSEAMALRAQDKGLNKQVKAFSKAMAQRIEEDSTRVRDYLDLIFISRFLERVGDHAKNIGEDAIFAEAAVDVRHGNRAELEKDE